MKRLGLPLMVLVTASCTLQVNNPEIGSRNRVDAQGNLAVAVQPGAAAATNGAPESTGPRRSPPATTSPGSTMVPTPPQTAIGEPQASMTPGSQPNVPSAFPTSASDPASGPSPANPMGTTAPTQTVDSHYRPPAFVALKTLPAEAIFEVIDFGKVVVASGTTLSISIDAGATWADHQMPGTLQALSWVDAQSGWGISDRRAIWKLDLSGGRLDVQVLDPIHNGTPARLHFTDANNGYLAVTGSPGMILRTSNGGKTWGNGVAVGEVNWTTRDGALSTGFYFDRGGSLAFINGSGQLYVWQAGGFTLARVPNMSAVGSVAYAGGRMVVRSSPSGLLAYSDDGTSFTAVNRDLRTSSQVLQRWLTRVAPITRDVWIGQGMWGALSLTRDGGTTWMEPATQQPGFTWLKSFSESQMWGALDDTTNLTLYRAGRL